MQTKIAQLQDNLGALDFDLSPESKKILADVSAPAHIHPYVFFGAQMQSMINGGAKIERWTQQLH